MQVPDARTMVAYGRSLGLTDEQVQAAFYGVTGRLSAAGWEPSVSDCRDWGRAMEWMAERGEARAGRRGTRSA